jgi:O-antigen biosynthesis alpha-1,2-mannosyltransferase
VIVGIDNISPGASTGAGTIGGMRAYLQDLLEFLPTLKPGWTFKLFTPETSIPDWWPRTGQIQLVSCKGVPSDRARRVFYEQAVLPRLIRRENLDVWLGICNILPLTCRCPSVVIVQSLQYFAFPRAYSTVQRLYLHLFGLASVRHADRVVALSFAAKEMIVKRMGIPPDRVVVAHNGVSQALVARLDSQKEDRSPDVVYQWTSGRPYLLSVSAFYEYKNLSRLIQAFAQVHSKITQQLVIVGAETSKVSRGSLHNLIHQLDMQDRIILTGRIPHEQIAAFYRYADATVMPSLEETFGMPVIEAMVLGCPVITSNIGSMAEIAGTAAHLVDPWSIDDIASGIERVLNDARCRDELRARGHEQVARFINDRSVDKIVSVLDMVGNAHNCH